MPVQRMHTMSRPNWVFPYVGVAADWPLMHWLVARDGALRGMWLRPSGRIYWVTGPAVLEELGIAKNTAKVAELTRRYEHFRDELSSRLANVKQKEFARRVRSLQRQLGEKANLDLQRILTKREYARLKQIDLQAAGPRALDYVEVAQALALTKEQRQSLTSLARTTSRFVKRS